MNRRKNSAAERLLTKLDGRKVIKALKNNNVEEAAAYWQGMANEAKSLGLR